MTVFKYFKREEFDDSESGANEIPDEFIQMLDELRERCGFPFRINSGYRSPQHSIEAAKDQPGEHTRAAADIAVSGGNQRFILAREAFGMGFTGIGVAKTFVHVDIRTTTPMLWVYG